MKVQTSAPRGKLRDRIVKGPISHVVSRGSRPFIRRRLMKEVKAQRRQAVLRQKDKTKPVGPRPTKMFHAVWRKMRGLEQEE
jgi:hypothetical protein